MIAENREEWDPSSPEIVAGNADMDILVLGNCLLHKENIPEDRLREREAYLKQFQLD